MIDTYKHPVLGKIQIHTHARARSIIMRAQTDGVRVTVPPHTSRHTVEETLSKFCNKLRQQQLQLLQHPPTQADTPSQKITPGFYIRNDLIHLYLKTGTRQDFYSQSQPGETVILFPPNTDFTSQELQEWLHLVIERALRQQAVWLLPQRLHQLSALHLLPFSNCKINVSKGRWGSCSARKSINLSCYLVTLPAHLRDYVMLHELCHTLEMNHGPRFWEKLNLLTDGQAKALRQELREYHTNF